MRNGHNFNGVKGVCAARVAVVVVLALLMLLTGCAGRGGGGNRSKSSSSRKRASDPHQSANPAQSQIILDAGYAALENQQYNEALDKADEFLAKTPHGAGSPEALYLKGRALEGKNAVGVVSVDEARANLQEARAAYIEALEQSPHEPLQSYLRASLGNVAYFQDDYPAAIAQLKAAYDKLDRDDLKAWALYRIGLSQQRLGQFSAADQTFAAVQQLHPSSTPAQRAREHRGARAFYVQLATFASAASADGAAADLRRLGVPANRVSDSQGRALLRAGPVASYSQAQYLRTRFLDKYPDAFIIP
jgi:outer membrane protein assembly factor BamD (BamD/ComL family)